MKKIHILKTDPAIFALERSGKKNFMVRYNDRNFAVGDIVISRETDYSGEQMLEGDKPLVYTGEIMIMEITYIFPGPFYTLPAKTVIMSYREIGSGEEI